MATNNSIPVVPQQGALADTLGHLLLDAIDDARSLDPAVFKLDMNIWVYRPAQSYSIPGDPFCESCLGGASMICRLDVMSLPLLREDLDETVALRPEDLPSREQCDKLNAINSLRQGRLPAAWHDLHSPLTPLPRLPDDLVALAMGASKVQQTPWVDDWQAHLALAHRLIELGI